MPFNVTPKQAGGGLDQIPLEDPSFDPTSIPLVKAVADAEVPGVVLSDADLQNPELEPLAKNGRALFEKTNLGMYRGKTGTALFNPGVVTPEEIKRLDEAGKLDQVLPPASKYLSGGGEEAPAPAVGGMPAPAPSGTQRARARSTFAGSLPPTRQPVPAGGSLLNDFVRSPA